MKTLVIVSHPDIAESGSQQYLLSSVPENESVMVHHLERAYPDGKIDVEWEQHLLNLHDRILFQFPFYWYSSPADLKLWQDNVLTDGFAYGKSGSALKGKEFSLIVTIGVNEEEYQAGGSELFSINELIKPYQAMAYKTGMSYFKPLKIFQFAYMSELQKMNVLIAYQQMLTRKKDSSLKSREKWLIKELKNTNPATIGEEDQTILRYAIERIEENRDTIDELKMLIDQSE